MRAPPQVRPYQTCKKYSWDMTLGVGCALRTMVFSKHSQRLAARDGPPSFVQEQSGAVVRPRDWIPAAFVL